MRSIELTPAPYLVVFRPGHHLRFGNRWTSRRRPPAVALRAHGSSEHGSLDPRGLRSVGKTEGGTGLKVTSSPTTHPPTHARFFCSHVIIACDPQLCFLHTPNEGDDPYRVSPVRRPEDEVIFSLYNDIVDTVKLAITRGVRESIDLRPPGKVGRASDTVETGLAHEKASSRKASKSRTSPDSSTACPFRPC